MRLTNYTDYALRVLIYLAVKDTDEKSTITEITEAYNVSRNHLMKVIHQLGKIGVIETTRGRGGGIVLAKPPEEITIGSIVRETEEDFYMVECFNSGANHCVLSPVCGLRSVLGEALAAYLAVLDNYTIADVIDQPLMFRGLLQIDP
ncbi:RrF2 family transcriptional regulator [Pseudogracilibacillus sp. ICA-222130]|uniref:RrF2 family transcriptional regulator n=1 Tax=Pseudogracilibacillus sp. ICA-222130 TaxID=3134655 RepID=UPI0030C2EE61